MENQQMSDGSHKNPLLSVEDSDPSYNPVEPLQKESAFIDISLTQTRYVMLAFAVFLCFGSYFVYDNPSALQTQLQDKLDIGSLEYNLLYSIYSFPNFILPLFGGYIIDAIGVRIGIMIFGILVVAGQCIFAFGVDISSYPIALVGRFVFGLGGESLNVGQSAIVSSWFEGKDLATALGVNISISRLGSVFNDYTEPPMDSATGSPDFGLWIGAAICGFSLFCGVMLVYLDKKRDTLMNVKGKKHLDESEKVKLSDVKEFGAMFWLLSINCLVIYVCVMSFNNIAANFFQTRFNFSTVESGIIISITYTVAAIICPFLGAVIDRRGKRTIYVIISAVMATLVHVIFLCLPDCDKCIWGALNLILLGFAYSIYASVMWACIPYTVPIRTVGTAFGVTTSIQNIGLGIGPFIIGLIHDNTKIEHGYFFVTMFLMLMGGLGVLTAIVLFVVDKRTGGVLYSNDPRAIIDEKNADAKAKKGESLPEIIKERKGSSTGQAELEQPTE